MNPLGNGKAKVYRVSQLGAAKQALARHYARAKIEGKGAELISALEHVYKRLRLDPHSFGEPKYRLHAMKMLVHLGIHDPLVVEFGIHDTEPLVMIRGVRYLD